MKKVMIGILVIIPVIIVLVVAMVSIFVSMSAHIAVDDITLDKKYLELEHDSSTSAYKLSDLFTTTITPDRATNREYTWTIEDLVCVDTDYEEMWEAGTVPPPAYVSENKGEELLDFFKNKDNNTCSQNGYLHINTYCSFVLKVQAETHTETCRVYVAGFKVEDFDIIIDKTTLTIGQNALISVETHPVEAIVDTWHYESSDENIVTVDKNGVINAVGEGTATIKVKASVHGEENKFVEKQINLTVERGATIYGNKIATSLDEILFSQLAIDKTDVEVVEGAELNENGIILTSETAILNIKGTEVIVEKCTEGDIVIDNADIFEAQEEGGFVLATSKKLYLTSSFANIFNTENPNVTWSSNRETIAKVDKNGVVTGVGSGRVVITATTADGKSASVTINVREVVTVLLVETPDACEQEGIAQETINGSMSYVDVLSGVDDLTLYVPNVNDFNFTKKNNSFEFNFQRPALPEGADKEEFYSAYTFKVQEYVGDTLVDSDKATFTSNMLTFNGDAIDGPTDLIVTISAKYPKFASRPEYTTVQFTVKVTKGVAVTSWVEMMAVAEENKVIFESNKTAEEKIALWDMCLACDIARADGYLPDDDLIAKLDSISAKVTKGTNLSSNEEELWQENGESSGLAYLKKMRDYARLNTIYLRGNSVYGNGHMIYGYKSQYVDETSRLNDKLNTLLYVVEGNCTVSNVILRACEVGDIIVDDAEDTLGLVANCIRFETAKTDDHTTRLLNNLIEFSLLENAETLIRCYNGDFTLDGCILRNTSSAALYVPIRRNKTGVMYSHININNCVFSNMLSTALNAFFDGYSNSDDPSSVAQALEDQKAGRTLVLNQTGFVDIYNWHSTDVLNIMSDISDLNLPVLGKVNLNIFITEALAENPEFKQYSRVYEQREHFHLGFVVSGITKGNGSFGFGQPYPICTFEDERIQCISTKDIFKSNGTYTAMLNGVLEGNEIFLYSYGQNGNLTPGTTYQINNRLIRHLHGEI